MGLQIESVLHHVMHYVRGLLLCPCAGSDEQRRARKYYISAKILYVVLVSNPFQFLYFCQMLKISKMERSHQTQSRSLSGHPEHAYAITQH